MIMHTYICMSLFIHPRAAQGVFEVISNCCGICICVLLTSEGAHSSRDCVPCVSRALVFGHRLHICAKVVFAQRPLPNDVKREPEYDKQSQASTNTEHRNAQCDNKHGDSWHPKPQNGKPNTLKNSRNTRLRELCC